jgi:uncharacterized membrane protein YfcA
MITAGITAVIAGILGVFGVKPGPYLVAVAVVVKVVIVLVGVYFGARWARKRRQEPPPSDPR